MTSPISLNTSLPIMKTSGTTPKIQDALWSKLGQELKSGNLSGAQTTFAAVKANYEQNKSATGGTSGTSGTSSGATPLRADVYNLAQALNSGSLSNAQAAYSTLVQDAKSAGIGGRTDGSVNVLA